jgi:hypothetical protein
MLVLAGLVGLVGCSTAQEPPASTPAADPPAAAAVTPADVASGMRKIDETAKEIAVSAGTDKARASSLYGLIEPTWFPIEGTVKQHDQNTYLAMEDNFAVLENAANTGDAAAAGKGASAISSAVQDYLAKNPG